MSNWLKQIVNWFNSLKNKFKNNVKTNDNVDTVYDVIDENIMWNQKKNPKPRRKRSPNKKK